MSASTRLLAMREDFFPVFFEIAVANYAAENVLGGRWPAGDAPALAREETRRLLAQGLATPDHHLFELHAGPGDTPVGFLWLAQLPRGQEQAVFVFQIHVEPEHRRQGHARAALQAAEAWARQRGAASLALHVFAHNTGARALYDSLGLAVSSLNLIKRLEPPAAD
ncbi:MAG: GNAT family N-acetyltransferase [Rubrivivax sp.]|nr:GNAT family N-acetyltransferase [Rubrivivax sp.]